MTSTSAAVVTSQASNPFPQSSDGAPILIRSQESKELIATANTNIRYLRNKEQRDLQKIRKVLEETY